MYPPQIVMPMKEELTSIGFEDLTTPEQVENAIKAQGTTLVFINSVCGCAAGNARPAVRMSLDNDKVPTRITTVFAGFDKEAVQKAREFMLPYPPSSPSIALFKNGELVYFTERLGIEGVSAAGIAEGLKGAYDKFC